MLSPSAVQEPWLPKAEAAALLGVSTREIERKAAAGRIRTNRVRLAGDRSDRTVYSADDLHRVRQERESGALQLAPAVAQRQALPDWLATALKPRADKPWLTIDEAADYSGLTARQIRKLVTEGTLRAWGAATSRRISKASIDAFSA